MQLVASKVPDPVDKNLSTMPVGVAPVTVIVHVDEVPTVTGLVQLTVVVVGLLPNNTVVEAELPRLFASPLYVAVIVTEPVVLCV